MSRVSTLLAAAALTLPLAAHAHTPPAGAERLGTVQFKVSCAAQAEFNRAVALLHSFWFQPADQAFRAIAAKEPSCGMAWWGVAMVMLGNPLAGAPTAQGLKAGLDIAWTALILSSFSYCILVFSGQASAVLSSAGQVTIADAFRTPAEAALMFGLLAVIGWSRILHVIKQMDSRALARSAMIDHLLRNGLGGILLMAFSLTCLAAVGSLVGAVFVAATLIGLAWWDLHAILEREHRGALMRIVARLAPLAASGLAAWGVCLAWFYDESVPAGVGLSESLPHVQRFMAYFQAWLQHPVEGYGLGSIEPVGDSATTLWNAKAMLAPGGAQNVFLHWLVEAGALGGSAMVLALGAIYLRIFSALGSRGMPRTFLRLAVAAGVLLLLHGVSDSSLDIPSVAWLYALLLGLACGVATSQHSERLGAIR
jgi:O-antigen ligase